MIATPNPRARCELHIMREAVHQKDDWDRVIRWLIKTYGFVIRNGFVNVGNWSMARVALRVESFVSQRALDVSNYGNFRRIVCLGLDWKVDRIWPTRSSSFVNCSFVSVSSTSEGLWREVIKCQGHKSSSEKFLDVGKNALIWGRFRKHRLWSSFCRN